MKKRKLANKIIVACIFMAIVIALVAGAVVGKTYWDGRMEQYRVLAYHYTHAAVDFIDAEKVIEYENTLVKDDYYYEVQDFIDAVKNNSDLQYYYVFVPHEDNLTYIWDAESEESCELGYVEEYMDNGKETLMGVFKKNPLETITVERDDTYGFIASAYSPIFDESGEPIALVGIDMSMPGVRQDIIKFVLLLIAAIIVVTGLCSIVFFNRIKKNVVTPINELGKTAKEMVDNIETETDLELNFHSDDELQDLYDSFSQMNKEIKDYISRLAFVTAEKERIGAELNVATNIQASMLPHEFPSTREYEICASMTPAKEVGGDFYDFFMVDESHLAIVAADVSGKGIPAALFMVIAKALIKANTTPEKTLDKVFFDVNNQLCEGNEAGMFVTAFEGVLDLKTGDLVYVNAGHEPPFIRDNTGKFVMHKLQPGLVLAGMDGMPYKYGTLHLEPGYRLFEYTDGVTEATSLENELFELDRLTESLNKHANEPLDELLKSVRRDIDEFVGEAPQFDDITMICLDYKEKME